MPTNVKVKNLPIGFQSIITNGRHSILGDEPVASKGTDLGLSPTELVLSGLAMCKAATVRHIARKHGWEMGNVDAELTQQVRRGADGKLATTVHASIRIEGALTPEQRAELLREADACYVHRMLLGDWNIEGATGAISTGEPSA